MNTLIWIVLIGICILNPGVLILGTIVVLPIILIRLFIMILAWPFKKVFGSPR